MHPAQLIDVRGESFHRRTPKTGLFRRQGIWGSQMDLQELTGKRLLWLKNRFFSVVTPTFVDREFVALNMTNILPAGPITISVFFSELQPF